MIRQPEPTLKYLPFCCRRASLHPYGRRKLRRGSEPSSIAARALARTERERVRNLPPISDPAMAPLRALLEDQTVSKTLQNAKFDLLVLRGAGIELRGLAFDTMVASYVLDPGRRSHGIDQL